MDTVEIKKKIMKSYNGLPPIGTNQRLLYEWIEYSEEIVGNMTNPQCFVLKCKNKPKKEVQRLEEVLRLKSIKKKLIPMVKTDRSFFENQKIKFIDNLSKRFLKKIYYRSRKNPNVPTKLVRNFFALEGDGVSVVYHYHAILDIPCRYTISRGIKIVRDIWKESTEVNQSVSSNIYHSNFNNSTGDFFSFDPEKHNFPTSRYIGYSMKNETKETGINFTDNFSV